MCTLCYRWNGMHAANMRLQLCEFKSLGQIGRNAHDLCAGWTSEVAIGACWASGRVKNAQKISSILNLVINDERLIRFDDDRVMMSKSTAYEQKFALYPRQRIVCCHWYWYQHKLQSASVMCLCKHRGVAAISLISPASLETTSSLSLVKYHNTAPLSFYGKIK